MCHVLAHRQTVHNVLKDGTSTCRHHTHVQNVNQVACPVTIRTSVMSAQMACTRRQMVHVHYAITHARTVRIFQHATFVHKGIIYQEHLAAHASTIALVATLQHIVLRACLDIGGLQVVVQVV